MLRTLAGQTAETVVMFSVFVFAQSGLAQEIDPVNHLPNPYETVRDWGSLPEGEVWGSVPGLQIDPDGYSLWVMDRCRTHSWQPGVHSCAGRDLPPIMKFDTRTGERVLAFGEDEFVFPHAIHVDFEGNVWIAESRNANELEQQLFPESANKGHKVVKFSPSGEILLTIGTPGVAGDPPERLNQPMDIAVAPNGDVFIAEGDHGGRDIGRISKFSAEGNYLGSFGRIGTGPGEFRVPHGMTFDSDGLLYVADRGNDRIQVFDQDGNYLQEFKQFGRPSDVAIDDNGFLYAIDSESGRRANRGWRKGIRIGRASDGEVSYFIPPHFIEDTYIWPSGVTSYAECAAGDAITVDAEGNIYAGEVGTGNPVIGITQYLRRFELEP